MADQYEHCVSVKRGEDYYRYYSDEYHEVCIDVLIEFLVPSDAEPPIAKTISEEGWWCLQEIAGGLTGLREKVIRMLDCAGVPLPARNETIRKIFEGVLIEYRRKSSVKEAVGIQLETKTTFLDDPESDEDEDDEFGESDEDEDDEFGESDEDEDDEFGESDEEEEEFGMFMEEDYPLRATPAKREAVESLEKVRVWGTERDIRCSVCLEEFSLGIEATKMPCSHIFHGYCLARWLESRCFCPLCKFELPMSVEEIDEIIF